MVALFRHPRPAHSTHGHPAAQQARIADNLANSSMTASSTPPAWWRGCVQWIQPGTWPAGWPIRQRRVAGRPSGGGAGRVSGFHGRPAGQALFLHALRRQAGALDLSDSMGQVLEYAEGSGAPSGPLRRRPACPCEAANLGPARALPAWWWMGRVAAEYPKVVAMLELEVSMNAENWASGCPPAQSVPCMAAHDRVARDPAPAGRRWTIGAISSA